MGLAAEPASDDARRLNAARTLALDGLTGELATDLQREGVRCILLKGPAMARWLYDDELLRNYVDIDLLVSPADLGAATSFLTNAGFELSFREVTLPHGRRPHATTWFRARDGANIDLHDTLPGLGVPPEAAWAELAQTTETMVVGRAEIPVLTEPARALLVALHAAHHGIEDAQPLTDLGRALKRVPESIWRNAGALADRLDALSVFAVGLRLLPEGRRLAATLELPDASTTEQRLRAGSAPELALSFDWLVHAPTFRARALLVSRKLAPPVGVMKARSKLARRGAVGLATAYAVNPVRVTWRAVPALRAWLAASRRS
jgi:hypothetical protein